MKITCAKCGKVVEEDNAVKQQTGIFTNYFCSEECTKKSGEEWSNSISGVIWVFIIIFVIWIIATLIIVSS